MDDHEGDARVGTDRSRTRGHRRDPAGAGDAGPVLAAVWCCSVGATWTLELHHAGSGRGLGTVVDWISSGVPTAGPEPDTLAADLVAERGLWLFRIRDRFSRVQRPSRHHIGYACPDIELQNLTRVVTPAARRAGLEPAELAAQWVAAGFCAQAAAAWMAAGIGSPQLAGRRRWGRRTDRRPAPVPVPRTAGVRR